MMKFQKGKNDKNNSLPRWETLLLCTWLAVRYVPSSHDNTSSSEVETKTSKPADLLFAPTRAAYIHAIIGWAEGG